MANLRSIPAPREWVADPTWTKRRPNPYALAKYGITVKQRQSLIDAQGGRCAICRKVPRYWHVDHDHETGHVRGMLCPACNSGLGMLGDNVPGLRRALRYLQRAGSVVG